MDVLDDLGMERQPIPYARCDACSSRAYLFTEIAGTELSYCGHHARLFLPKLRTLGVPIFDMTHAIEG